MKRGWMDGARKWAWARRLACVAWLLGASLLAWGAPAMAEEAGRVLALTLDAGWRHDQLDWNIANDLTGTTTPNVLSELRWRNLRIWEGRVGAEAEARRVVFRGHAGYGAIASGVNEDSDYAGNHRSLEWSRSRNDAGAGYVADVVGGLGWRWGDREGLGIAPMAGYAWHRQSLRMRNGNQVLSRVVTINGVTYRPPPLGPFPGLNSTYEAEWQGPWLGAELDWRHAAWSMRLTGRYEWSRYRAKANWNLRADLARPVSFRHRAHGHGWVAGFRLERVLTAAVRLGVGGEWRRFDTNPGTDTTYMADGTVGGVTRLNGVHWRSYGLHASLRYDF